MNILREGLIKDEIPCLDINSIVFSNTGHLVLLWGSCTMLTYIQLKFDLNPRKLCFFRDVKVCGGGGGFHRKSSNIAIGQCNALKSWPYTSKFTYDHPEQI